MSRKPLRTARHSIISAVRSTTGDSRWEGRHHVAFGDEQIRCHYVGAVFPANDAGHLPDDPGGQRVPAARSRIPVPGQRTIGLFAERAFLRAAGMPVPPRQADCPPHQEPVQVRDRSQLGDKGGAQNQEQVSVFHGWKGQPRR